MTEDEYVDLVGRVQGAMAIEPFRPALQDVVVLIAEWRVLSNENERLSAEIMRRWRGRSAPGTTECQFCRVWVGFDASPELHPHGSDCVVRRILTQALITNVANGKDGDS